MLLTFGASTASATTGGAQYFVWSDRAEIASGTRYTPVSSWTTPEPEGPSIEQTGRGEYNVAFADHQTDKPLQAQVVAYGTNDVRCKFTQPHETVTCTGSNPGVGLCTMFFVSCHTAAGARANSQFVLSFSATKINGNAPGGTAGFVETTNETEIQKRWRAALPIRRGSDLNFLNTHGGRPTITKVGTGYYSVTLPGLGTSTLGVTQVTAIGADATHCKTTAGYAQGSDLKVSVGCYVGASAADSDFILNYDRYATRPSNWYQGARAHGNQPTVSSYTPARSWSTPGTTGAEPGQNLVLRSERGRYTVWHSALVEILSSAWVGAVGMGQRNYCKLESWFANPFGSGGVFVNLRCHASNGDLVDTEFVETYQGTVFGPE